LVKLAFTFLALFNWQIKQIVSGLVYSLVIPRDLVLITAFP
jgi:hypothetical protein